MPFPYNKKIFTIIIRIFLFQGFLEFAYPLSPSSDLKEINARVYLEIFNTRSELPDAWLMEIAALDLHKDPSDSSESGKKMEHASPKSLKRMPWYLTYPVSSGPGGPISAISSVSPIAQTPPFRYPETTPHSSPSVSKKGDTVSISPSTKLLNKIMSSDEFENLKVKARIKMNESIFQSKKEAKQNLRILEESIKKLEALLIRQRWVPTSSEKIEIHLVLELIQTKKQFFIQRDRILQRDPAQDQAA